MRLRPIGLLLSGVVVASSACSMDATAPSSSMSAPQGAMMAKSGQNDEVGNGRGDRFAGSVGTTFTVTIDPKRRNLLRFGPHTLEIPARAICGSGSGYGLQYFDRDCRAEQSSVTITAVVRATPDGIPRIDMYPQMRFDPRATVTLTMYVPHLSPTTSDWKILYCATHSTALCVDESLRDPTLVTRTNYRESTLFRRIRHFSGSFVES
jgi:hypothetical protein